MPQNPLLLLLLLLTSAASPIYCQIKLQTDQLRRDDQLDARQQQQVAAEPVYLESLEDLEHVAYMSMRNFNLTGKSLLQSSWLMNSLGGNPLQHKQHQPDPAASIDPRGRLALQLESFIAHLRNGHLRRLRTHELASIYESSGGEPLGLASDDTVARQQSSPNDTEREQPSTVQPGGQMLDRCHYLVGIYQLELKERQAAAIASPSTQQQRQRIEYETSATGDQVETLVYSAPVAPDRLRHLCQLAIKCHSAEELVQLISGPAWQSQAAQEAEPRRARRLADSQPARSPTKSLRDSLSLSIAKLCPLILFQLHDDDGLCSIRRDDRPPTLTVWGFATLFVTIVSFCSLIGLSITPLIGPVPSDSSGSGSLTAGDYQAASPVRRRHTGGGCDRSKHQHRACLTLFEGLAVGSLVGSALFSLIPQAFELQERESNQGFLLKALIIFFGIYLFFCSERLMRIILDMRRLRKKRKRLLNHRSSNSIQMHHSPDYFYQPPSQASKAIGHRAIAKATGSEKRISEPSAGQVSGKSVALALSKLDTCKGGGNHLRQQQHQRPTSRQVRARKLLTAAERRRMRRQALGKGGRQQIDGLDHDLVDNFTSDLDTFSTRVRSNSSSSSHSSLSSANSFYCRSLGTLNNTTSSSHRQLAPDLYYYRHSSADGDADEQSADELTDCGPVDQVDVKRASFQLADNRDGDKTAELQEDNEDDDDYYVMRQPHETKRDISTVAWMIVLGDGLHNFIDGISIGAAFSESILSGVSISVAVICEEFPHELGDFAVLVSSGMTVRQALGYNFLSACTCYFGMALGIILGDVNDGASYISALAAGVFLYIALVDMMGELSAALEETSRNSIAKTLKLLLLQNVGIFIGISIIFILSFIDF